MSVVITKDDIMAYAEVDYIIHHMNERYLNKLPEKLIYFFENIKDPEHEVYIEPHKPLQNQGLKQYALEVLAILHLKYWCESEERKKELLAKMRENQQKLEQQMHDKYNIDNIFDNPAVKEEKEEVDSAPQGDFSKPRTVTVYSNYAENNPDIKDYTDLKEEHVQQNEETKILAAETKINSGFLSKIFEMIKSKLSGIKK